MANCIWIKAKHLQYIIWNFYIISSNFVCVKFSNEIFSQNSLFSATLKINKILNWIIFYLIETITRIWWKMLCFEWNDNSIINGKFIFPPNWHLQKFTFLWIKWKWYIQIAIFIFATICSFIIEFCGSMLTLNWIITTRRKKLVSM